MAGIPVMCQHCRHAFSSRLLNISGNVEMLSISSCAETCPACGRQTNLLEGRFRMENGIISLIDGPAITVNSLKAMQSLFENIAPSDLADLTESQVDDAAGSRGFVKAVTDWANKVGYTIDKSKNWHGRIVFVAWLIREVAAVISRQ